jgi:hypothetical protein
LLHYCDITTGKNIAFWGHNYAEKIANWEDKTHILISLRNLSKSQIIDYPNKPIVFGGSGFSLIAETCNLEPF